MLPRTRRWAIATGFVITVAVFAVGVVRWRDRAGETGQTAVSVSRPVAHPALTATAPQPAPPPPSSKPAPVMPAKAAADKPHFDVVRVEPNGDTVLAGRGAPNSSVDLVASGKVLAQASTDAEGHFVMLPPPLQPGDYALTLRQKSEDKASAESAQSVTVSLPKKGQGQLVVALAEPGQPTKLLSPPPVATPRDLAPPGTTPAPAPKAAAAEPGAAAGSAPAGAPSPAQPAASVKPPRAPALVIRSVELENGNGFYASGAAAPGTKIHIYLNNSHLAEVTAGPDGEWSVKIRKGLTGGHYVVRADATPDGSHVSARAEVPFDVPTVMAEAQPSKAAPLAANPATATPKAEPAKPPSRAASAPSRPAVAAAPPPRPAAPSPSTAAEPSQAAAVAVPHQEPPAPGSTPAQPVSRPPPAAPVETAGASASAAHAVIDEVDTTIVREGDNLWDISRVRLGQGRRYTRIFAANLSQIRDPDLIYPGQIFVLPSRTE